MAFEILSEASVPVADLQADPRNVNVHDERNLEAITASLKKFGQPERLIVRKSDGIVFSGNGRLEAMHRLGIQKARVQWVEGTDDECRGYAVAANRTARLSRFDDVELNELLQELKAQDPGLVAAAGFNEKELEKLADSLTPEVADEDAAPDLAPSKSTPAVKCPSCGTTFAVGGA